MVKSAADELNSDARELISAARIPQTMRPLTPAGSSLATSVGNAASGVERRKTSPLMVIPSCERANAIIPGIRNRNTGRSFR